MRKDAPKPDTSTAEALKRLLLDVKGTTYTDPKSGGVSWVLFVNKLGIAEEVNKQSKLVIGVHNSELVAKGEVELAVQAPSFKAASCFSCSVREPKRGRCNQGIG